MGCIKTLILLCRNRVHQECQMNKIKDLYFKWKLFHSNTIRENLKYKKSQVILKGLGPKTSSVLKPNQKKCSEGKVLDVYIYIFLPRCTFLCICMYYAHMFICFVSLFFQKEFVFSPPWGMLGL